MQLSEIENILPLSPLQEGLLFHAVYDDHGPDVYTVQLRLELEGPLDPHRLRSPPRRPWYDGMRTCREFNLPRRGGAAGAGHSACGRVAVAGGRLVGFAG